VQQKVEEAFSKLFGSSLRLHSSSRTDTGVHALGMVAHVAIARGEFKIPARKLALALNAFLPEDIRVLRAVRSQPDFHARFDAIGKQYRYFVWNHTSMNPLLRHQAWHVPQPLDLEAMRAGAKVFLGKHDFKSFAATRGSGQSRTRGPVREAPDPEPGSTVRTLRRCDIKRSGPLLSFIIEGDGFLYKMCRGIVGTLVQLGRGRFTQTDLKHMMAAKDRRMAGMTAPALGLVLWKVFY
jgi:tRNA pseudouridine38-40 synthase